jgi:hypothetical protein
MLAIAVEKKTYKHREKGAHRGALGALTAAEKWGGPWAAWCPYP